MDELPKIHFKIKEALINQENSFSTFTKNESKNTP